MARRRSGKKIDFVHWTASGPHTAASLAAGSQGVQASTALHLPETIMRTRGEWTARFEGAQAGGAGVQVTAGLILVPEGTGTTVLWSPLTDSEAPWFWWDTMNLTYEEYVTDVIWASNVADGRRVVDSKAMRIVKNMEMQFVVENTTTGNAASIACTGMFRILSGT